MEIQVDNIENIKNPAVFSTRLGGSSADQFSSLNLGFTYGDNLDNVLSNWGALSDYTNISLKNFVFANQVHHNDVAVIDKNSTIDLKGLIQNANDSESIKRNLQPIGDFDGLVTCTPGTTLSIFTADCACVLLSDYENHIVAALHCGWKPLVKDILKVGIAKMSQLGAEINNIQAAIGPCIGKCCFEVGPEVIEKLEELLGDEAKSCYTKNNNGKFNMDLQKSVQAWLIQLGVSPHNITSVNKCTSCNTDRYFSYRAENGNTGRLAGIIQC